MDYGDMSEGVSRPLLFVKVRSRLRMGSEARGSASAESQLVTIARWAEQQDQTLAKPVLLARTRASYSPEQDPKLCEVIQISRGNRDVLVMDDVFRFTRGCDAAEAEEIFRGLLRLEPLIFSIRHGAPLHRLKSETVRNELLRCAIEFRRRSERGKRAASSHGDGQGAPTRQALRSAARARGVIADHKARQLADEIERVTHALPPEKQTNRSAIARALDEAGIAPPSGAGQWQATTVTRVLDRAQRSQK